MLMSLDAKEAFETDVFEYAGYIFETRTGEHVDIASGGKGLQHAFQTSGFRQNFVGAVTLVAFVIYIQTTENILKAGVRAAYFFKHDKRAAPVQRLIDTIEQGLANARVHELHRVISNDQIAFFIGERQDVISDEADVRLRCRAQQCICLAGHGVFNVDAHPRSGVVQVAG